MRFIGGVVVAFVAALAAISGGPAVAAGHTGDPKPPVPIRVVLPHGYADSGKRWPVVYDLNTITCPGPNAESCDLQKKIIEAAARMPFITVFQANGTGQLSDYVDWADGSHHNDATYIALVRWVDSRYRTLADRGHRAFGGLSAGAYGAFLIAARHPQLFGQIGSISGPLDIRGPADSFEPIFVATGGPSVSTAIWGTPVVDDESWKAANPTDLVARLKGMKVWVANGNGVPCDADDGPQANPIGSFIEGVVGLGSANFVNAARAAGVSVSYHPDPCGVHTYRYFLPRTVTWLRSLRFAR